MERVKWRIASAGVGMLLTACGGSSSSSASAANSSNSASKATIGGKLVIDNVSGSTWTCQFNPFNSSVLGPGITFALIYEPLEYVNILQSTKPPTPWLATSSQWSNGFKTLTFTIRNGVKWTDG